MKTSFHRLIVVCFVLFVSSCAQTNAKEANLQPLREILGPQTQVLQDATKWPKAVPVRSPDPVFGSASHLEVWSYDQRFAKRFEGFPEDQADPDMPAGLWAVVLRVYKQSYSPVVEGLRYACQLELYVNDDVPVRASQISVGGAGGALGELPSSVTTLVANDGRDAQLLKTMAPLFATVRYADRGKPTDNPHQQITGLQFTDGKLRGILNTFGIYDYRKNFLPGMQMMRTGVEDGNGGCEKFYPIAKDSKMVVRLGDTDPYDSYNTNLRPGTRVSVSQLDTPSGSLRAHPNLPNNGIWKWTPQDAAKGLIALPDKISKRGIEIVAMARDLNRCIIDENEINQGHRNKLMTEAKKAQRLQVCKQLRDTGELYYRFGYDSTSWLNMDVEWECPAAFLKNKSESVYKANAEWCARPNPR